MAVKPAILLDTATTLVFSPPEGTPTGTPTAVLYDESGTEYSTPTVTISGVTLTCPVPAALVDRVATNYRCKWTYVVGSTTYTRNQTFDCVPCIVYQTLTATKLTGTYYPILAGREFPTASFDNVRALAWEWMHNLILARGKDANRVVDPLPLEPIHAALTAAHIARNYRPGTTTDWQQWAGEREKDAVDRLDAVLAACSWYETGDDMKPASDEQQVNIGRLRMVR